MTNSLAGYRGLMIGLGMKSAMSECSELASKEDDQLVAIALL